MNFLTGKQAFAMLACTVGGWGAMGSRRERLRGGEDRTPSWDGKAHAESVASPGRPAFPDVEGGV